jgi:hypothetical protein
MFFAKNFGPELVNNDGCDTDATTFREAPQEQG